MLLQNPHCLLLLALKDLYFLDIFNTLLQNGRRSNVVVCRIAVAAKLIAYILHITLFFVMHSFLCWPNRASWSSRCA